MEWLGWRLRLGWWRHQCAHYRWKLSVIDDVGLLRVTMHNLDNAMRQVNRLELQAP